MLSQRHPHQYHKIYQSIKSFTLAKVHLIYFLYEIIVEKFNNVQIYFKYLVFDNFLFCHPQQ